MLFWRDTLCKLVECTAKVYVCPSYKSKSAKNHGAAIDGNFASVPRLSETFLARCLIERTIYDCFMQYLIGAALIAINRLQMKKHVSI